MMAAFTPSGTVPSCRAHRQGGKVVLGDKQKQYNPKEDWGKISSLKSLGSCEMQQPGGEKSEGEIVSVELK